MLLQALWHILAESCVLLFYFHSCHEAFHKTAVELSGFVTNTALLLPGSRHQQKHCFFHVCLSERLTLLLQAGEICKSTQLLHEIPADTLPSSLFCLKSMDLITVVKYGFQIKYPPFFKFKKHITNYVNTEAFRPHKTKKQPKYLH